MEERLCNICNGNVIESEIHFLFYCPSYNIERNLFYEILNENYPDFASKPDNEKLKIVMNENNIISFSKFVCGIYVKRNSILYK